MSIRVRIPSVKAGVTFSNTKLMRSIGQAMVGRIRARTESGRDFKGRPFRALSPEYAKQKRRHLGSASNNLTVSGRMLNDMVAKPRPNGVIIQFASSGGKGSGTFIQRSRAVGGADKAFYHNVSGAGRSKVIREFFNLSPQDEEFILDRVGAFIQKAIS